MLCDFWATFFWKFQEHRFALLKLANVVVLRKIWSLKRFLRFLIETLLQNYLFLKLINAIFCIFIKNSARYEILRRRFWDRTFVKTNVTLHFWKLILELYDLKSAYPRGSKIIKYLFVQIIFNVIKHLTFFCQESLQAWDGCLVYSWHLCLFSRFFPWCHFVPDAKISTISSYKG